MKINFRKYLRGISNLLAKVLLIELFEALLVLILDKLFGISVKYPSYLFITERNSIFVWIGSLISSYVAVETSLRVWEYLSE